MACGRWKKPYGGPLVHLLGHVGLRPEVSGGVEEGQCAGLSHMALLAQKYLETHCQGHGWGWGEPLPKRAVWIMVAFLPKVAMRWRTHD